MRVEFNRNGMYAEMNGPMDVANDYADVSFMLSYMRSGIFTSICSAIIALASFVAVIVGRIMSDVFLDLFEVRMLAFYGIGVTVLTLAATVMNVCATVFLIKSSKARLVPIRVFAIISVALSTVMIIIVAILIPYSFFI